MDYTIEQMIAFREMDDIAAASQIRQIATYERMIFTFCADRVNLPAYKKAHALLKIDRQERRRLAELQNWSQGWAPPQTEDLFRKYHQRRKGRNHGRR